MLTIQNLLINDGSQSLAVDTPPFFTLYLESEDGMAQPVRLLAQLRDTTWHRDAPWQEFTLDAGDLHRIFLPEEANYQPHHSYEIRFLLWDSQGGVTISPIRSFYFAYAQGSTWQGRFLTANCPQEREQGVAPVFEFRRSFSLEAPVVSARLYVTALGVYAPFCNGSPVGEDVLTPGWFTYYAHLAYQVYDVSNLVKQGDNCLSILVGDGWYKGYLTSSWHRNYYGNRRQLLWELRLTLADGSQRVLASDGKTQWRETPIRMSEIYSGEICNRALPEDTQWKPVVVSPWNHSFRLHTAVARPIHFLEPLVPQKILRTPNGERVVDFGRVITGVVELRKALPRGTNLVMDFGDTLGPDGNFYNDNVELFSLREHDRPVMQRVEFTAAGTPGERYRPTFTYQCFRYMRLSGTEISFDCADFLAWPLSSFTRQTGSFSCGDQGVNAIFRNTIATEKATFLDIPVAGPMRAERLGWTGDNQLMFPLAMRTMFDSSQFLGKWLEEVKHSQGADGQVGTLAPYVNFEPGATCRDFHPAASAIWGDAATICPWLLYEFYGDKELLRRYRDLALGYVEYMRRSGDCQETFTQGETFGDWFALDNGEDAYPGRTDKAFLGNVYYYRSTDMLIRILHALEDPREAEYRQLLGRIGDRLRSTYFRDGYLTEPTQAAAALVIAFGIAREPEKVGAQLCQLLEKSHGHLLTGFTGTAVILQALCQIGRGELALKAVTARDYPSWIYTIEKGATTIWEHFNGVKPDGTYWDANMNSFCHLTFGTVAEWLYGYLLGLRQPEGGIAYRKLLVDPLIVPSLGWAEGSFDTVYGTVAGGWKCRDGMRTIQVKLPYGIEGTLMLREAKEPEALAQSLCSRGYTVTFADEATLRVTLGWGTHTFTFPEKEKEVYA